MGNDSLTLFIIVFATFVLCWFSPLKYRSWILIFSCWILLSILNSYALLLFGSIAFINFITTKYLRLNPFFRNTLIVFNILTLVFIKLLTQLSSSFSFLGDLGSFLFPVGFSIFIFHQISFIIDLSRLDLMQEIELSEYLLYSFFIGNFLTGPVAKFTTFHSQENNRLIFKTSNLTAAVTLIIVGLFKKMVIADNIAPMTRLLFDSEVSSKQNLLFPFLLNKYEIFANFSGFSDIALGVAYIFGIRLPINFNQPFATTSIKEFWRRWHISLVSWINEYVFYPMITSPFSILGVQVITAITFLIFALWHKLSWNHLCYGLIQFLLIFAATKWERIPTMITFKTEWSKKIIRPLKWLWFYVILISIPGLLFRSDSLSHFIKILINLTHMPLKSSFFVFVQYRFQWFVLLFSIPLVEIAQSLITFERFMSFLLVRSIFSRTLMLLSAVLLIALLCNNAINTDFIYAKY